MKALTIPVLMLAALPAFAQTSFSIAQSCVDQIEDGNMDGAALLAEEIRVWKNLFSPNLIELAEQCLSGTTNEEWRYSTIQSKFLSGEEAIAEQEFIANAAKRREERKQAEAERQNGIMERLCTIEKIETAISKFNTGLNEVLEARSREVEIMTRMVCEKVYLLDKDAAILDPVCNAAFRKSGLPDSQYELDIMSLISLEIKLAEAKLDLAIFVGLDNKNIDPEDTNCS